MNPIKHSLHSSALILGLGFGIASLLAPAPQAQGQPYQHLILYGQSLATGQQSWPPISTNSLPNTFMLGQQVWSNLGNPLGSSPPPLNPLIANVAVVSAGMPRTSAGQITAECPLVGAANHIQLKTGGQSNVIATSCGFPGRTIEELSKEYYAPTNYGDFSNALRHAYSACTNIAASIHCPAVFWMQGEYNYAGIGTGLTPGSKPTTDKNTYKALLITLKENLQSDITARYQQPDKPRFITYQVGAQYTQGTNVAIGMAQLEASNEHSDIVCAGPVYPVTDRGGHLDPNGYRWYGEMLGKVYYKTVVLHQNFKPFQPLQIARTSNPRVLQIKYLVPQLPLVLETNLVPPVASYGFEVFNSGTKVTINTVAINGDTVVLTCAADLTGDLQVVYAGKNTLGSGNLRDSDDYPAFYNYLDLDKTNQSGAYVFPRDSGSLRPANEPRDTNGAVIYDKPYPLYNFSVAFYYKLNAGQQVYNVPVFPVVSASPATGASVVLNWSPTNCVLEETASLALPNWAAVAGTTIPYVVLTTNAQRFYRARLP